MLAPVMIAAPADSPITLAEAKAHLRVDASDDDDLIQGLIDAAVGHVDGYTGILGRALVTQTWAQSFPYFCNQMRLPLAPVEQISSVTYFDGSNVQQTLATSVYELVRDAGGAYAGLKPDQTWPSSYSRRDAVTVTYVAGVAASDVPKPIKQAMLLMIGNFYENRDAVVTGTIVSELPFAVNALLSPYRRIGI